ncbi:hypothetical protein FISHEDRAFT_5789, partial [Fistulina hepatica ATCC 64428]
LVKLVIFSLVLGILPLVSYFGSKVMLWDGNSTYAAVTAIVAANLVLVAYIFSALAEDATSSSKTTVTEGKKKE